MSDDVGLLEEVNEDFELELDEIDNMEKELGVEPESEMEQDNQIPDDHEKIKKRIIGEVKQQIADKEPHSKKRKIECANTVPTKRELKKVQSRLHGQEKRVWLNKRKKKAMQMKTSKINQSFARSFGNALRFEQPNSEDTRLAIKSRVTTQNPPQQRLHTNHHNLQHQLRPTSHFVRPLLPQYSNKSPRLRLLSPRERLIVSSRGRTIFPREQPMSLREQPGPPRKQFMHSREQLMPPRKQLLHPIEQRMYNRDQQMSPRKQPTSFKERLVYPREESIHLRQRQMHAREQPMHSGEQPMHEHPREQPIRYPREQPNSSPRKQLIHPREQPIRYPREQPNSSPRKQLIHPREQPIMYPREQPNSSPRKQLIHPRQQPIRSHKEVPTRFPRDQSNSFPREQQVHPREQSMRSPREQLLHTRENPVHFRDQLLCAREQPIGSPREQLMEPMDQSMHTRQQPISHPREQTIRSSREQPLHTREGPMRPRDQPRYPRDQPISTRDQPTYPGEQHISPREQTSMSPRARPISPREEPLNERPYIYKSAPRPQEPLDDSNIHKSRRRIDQASIHDQSCKPSLRSTSTLNIHPQRSTQSTHYGKNSQGPSEILNIHPSRIAHNACTVNDHLNESTNNQYDNKNREPPNNLNIHHSRTFQNIQNLQHPSAHLETQDDQRSKTSSNNLKMSDCSNTQQNTHNLQRSEITVNTSHRNEFGDPQNSLNIHPSRSTRVAQVNVHNLKARSELSNEWCATPAALHNARDSHHYNMSLNTQAGNESRAAQIVPQNTISIHSSRTIHNPQGVHHSNIPKKSEKASEFQGPQDTLYLHPSRTSQTAQNPSLRTHTDHKSQGHSNKVTIHAPGNQHSDQYNRTAVRTQNEYKSRAPPNKGNHFNIHPSRMPQNSQNFKQIR